MPRALLVFLALVSLAFPARAAQVVGAHPYEYGPFYFKNFKAGGSGYTPPTPNGVCMLGDSRTDYTIGGPVYASGSYQIKVAAAYDYQNAVLGYVSGNVTPYPVEFGRGVSSQSTLGVLDRMTSSSVALSGNPAFSTTAIAQDAYFNSNTLGANFQITLASGTLTVSSFSAGNNGSALAVGETINEGSGTTTTITALGTGTGGNGTYTVADTTTAIGTAQNAWVMTANQESGGPYTILTDPNCSTVFLLNGTNDVSNGSITLTSAVTNIDAELTALGPTTGNKKVLLADETPRGVAFSGNGEVHALVGTTQTVTNSSTWISDQVVLNGHTMPGVSYTDGAGNMIYYTKVGSAPASGQYSVAAGVYTFNATDTGRSLTYYYSYAPVGNDLSGSATKINMMADLHSYLTSTAATFTGPCTGTNTGKPGALYNRPWVTSVDTWTALGGTTGCAVANVRNTPGVFLDGLHPDDVGVVVGGAPIATAVQALYGTTPIIAPTVYNNAWVGTGNNSNKTFSGTLPGLMVAQIAAYHSANPSGGPFQICYLAICAVDTAGTGTLTGTGTSASTINYSTGVYSVTFTVAPPSTGKVIAYIDPANLLVNGFFDVLANGAIGNGTITASGASTCVAANIPNGLSITLGAGIVTNTGTGTGPLVLTCGSGTDPAGNAGFYIKAAGTAPAATATIAVKNSLYYPTTQLNAVTPPYDNIRGFATMVLSPGPGGHLIGVSLPQIASAVTFSGNGLVNGLACPTTACAGIGASINLNGTSNGLTDLSLLSDSNTDRRFNLMAPIQSVALDGGATISASSLTETIQLIPSATVDFTIWFENSAIRKTSK